MTTPTATLTSASPSYEFTAQPGATKFVATSGPTGAGVIKHQFKVHENDLWYDNPNIVFATVKQLHQRLEVAAVFNRITVTGADGTTNVNLTL